MHKVGDRLQLHIDRMAIGGRGVGRAFSISGDSGLPKPGDRGLVVFVEDVAPNEDVEVQLTLVKKSFAEARLVRVVTPSPSRVTPPCPVAGRCGGCSWQHISYAEQLKQKRALVAEALRKFSGFGEVPVAEVVPSPNELHYRNRIQIHHEENRAGFYGRASHQIVDINECVITEEPLNEKLREIKKTRAPHRERIEILRDQSGVVRTRGAGEADEALAFSQVNSAQNENLIRAVVADMQAAKPFSYLLDLYSGSGNFTFPLADAFPNVLIEAVELNAPAIAAGTQRAQAESRAKVRFNEAKVESFMRRYPKKQGQSYGVLIDPPRSGCAPEVMPAIMHLNPTVLVYVSCHPVTLARDIKPLQEAGWQLLKTQPFDMFPQTDHIETLVVMAPPC